VLVSRAAYSAARARVFKDKAAGDLEGARQVYTHDMVGKRETSLATLAKLSQRV
jgi:methyl-accepting chemotaxis protein